MEGFKVQIRVWNLLKIVSVKFQSVVNSNHYNWLRLDKSINKLIQVVRRVELILSMDTNYVVLNNRKTVLLLWRNLNCKLLGKMKQLEILQQKSKSLC